MGYPGPSGPSVPARPARLARHRRGLHRRRLGLRGSSTRCSAACWLGYPATAPVPRGRLAQGAAIAVHEPADPAPLAGGRGRALRHRPPDVRALPRALEPVHLLLLRRHHRPRASGSPEARDAVRQARAQGRRPAARHRLRLGRLREVRGPDPRLRGHGHQPVRRSRSATPSITRRDCRSRSASSTTATCRTRGCRRSTRSRSSA